MEVPKTPNHSWSMDFMSDALENGRKIRIFNVIDDFNREALWVNAQYSYPAEFISKKLAAFCEDKEIRLEFIQPEKPTQNAYVERFNRHIREDVLDAYIFSSMSQLNIICDKWKKDYNDNHPHRSLGYKSPIAFNLALVLRMIRLHFAIAKY